MFNIFDYRKGSRFRQNFIKVAFANLLAQGMPIIAAPLVTRLYSPSDFGTFALFSSILVILSSVATLRVDWSIPNASSRQQAMVLLLGGGGILLLFSISIALLVWAYGNKLLEHYDLEMLLPFLLWLPLAILGMGLHQLLQGWHVREANLSPVSRSNINKSIFMTLSQIGLGLINTGTLGLILSLLGAIWVSVMSLLRHTLNMFTLIGRCTYLRFMSTMRSFFSQSLQSTGVALINTTNLSMLPILLIVYYSPTEVGWLALMQRLALAPLGVFTAALAQSFWAEAADQIKKDPAGLRRLYIQSTKKLVYISLLPVFLCALGPYYVGLILGSEWDQAGWVLISLIPMLFGQVVVSPLSHLVVHRKQHWQLCLDIMRFVATVASVMLLAAKGISFIPLLVFVSIINLGFYGVIFYLNLKAYKID